RRGPRVSAPSSRSRPGQVSRRAPELRFPEPRHVSPRAPLVGARPGVGRERAGAVPILGANEVGLRDAPILENDVPAHVLVSLECIERRHERAGHLVELPGDGPGTPDEPGVRAEIDERVGRLGANAAEKTRTAKLPVMAEAAPERSV